MRDVERRTITTEIRAQSEGEGPPTIVGYASVFNEPSEDLGGFREVILPGAFDRALKESHDVRALVNHDPNKILGRTKAKTLELKVDKRGLLSTIHPPDTQVARDTLESVKRGDMDGMSFAFRVLEDDWRVKDGDPLREVKDLELLDVSVVAYPAYPQTEVSARALSRAKEIEQDIPLEIRRRRLAQRVREAS